MNRGFSGLENVHHKDALWVWWPRFLWIGLVSGFLVNINRVSLLNFYRDRLADCYVIEREAVKGEEKIATLRESDYRDVTSKGGLSS